MTTANMKLVTVDVLLDDKLETPTQQLDEGEAIVVRVIPLTDLKSELKSMFCMLTQHLKAYVCSLAYAGKGFFIDAKLAHFANGYDMTMRLKEGSL
jgi:ADP-ribose pyrophosphatase